MSKQRNVIYFIIYTLGITQTKNTNNFKIDFCYVGVNSDSILIIFISNLKDMNLYMLFKKVFKKLKKKRLQRLQFQSSD